MKFKHIAMLFATLFLPACSNNTTNNNDVERLNAESIENVENFEDGRFNNAEGFDNSELLNSENINGYDNNPSVKYGVDVIDNRSEIDGLLSPQIIDNNTDIITTPTLISTFSTKVYTKTNARMNNLNIVCNKISGYVVGPNEEFSYNSVAGPYDKAHGFGKATVLMGDGKEVQGYGGGVCQVSSTLYNAVKDCGVEITERHNHSKDVYYVPRNQDATVSYGFLDFKFRNLNSYPLRIEASANKQNVTVEIYRE